MNTVNRKLRVLVAPLEWGLGHATRCIPIIAELIQQQCDVFIAAEGAGYILLKNEFPGVTFLSLRGYRISLSRTKKLLFWKLFWQLPKIIYTIYREHRWLNKIIKQYTIDAVISDNRFGMHNKKIISIYITHQLRVKTGNLFTDKIATYIHSSFINKYTECWVPDFEKNDLAGELSHAEVIPLNVKYIGPLSRFRKVESPGVIHDLLITISGPEPQRTLFEKLILNHLQNYDGKVLLIRGLPDSTEGIESTNASVTIINHLPGEDLGKAIQQSAVVISRSGYTTIMDLVKLNKSAILIPTPGQAEQEYLAAYLMKRNIFFTASQEDFKLKQTLAGFALFRGAIPEFDMQQYKPAIQELTQLLRHKVL